MFNEKNFYFIYGNYERLSNSEDFYALIGDLLAYCLDKPFFLSDVPVPGHCNIYYEDFDATSRELIRQAKEKDPETKVVCIATEIPTGNTFNSFGPARPANFFTKSKELAQRPVMAARDMLFSRGLLPALKKHPIGQFVRGAYRKIMGSIYTNSRYNKSRYDNFVQTLPLLDRVWYLVPDQEKGYAALVDPAKLWRMPTIPFVDQAPAPSGLSFVPDIDFLFTGNQTPYRLGIVAELREKGYNVVSGFYPEIIRKSYLERARVCLHIKPHKDWAAPSPMRLHWLLMAGKCVVSEGVAPSDSVTAPQAPFVTWASGRDFIEAATKAAEDSPLERGLKAREGYIAATRALRAKTMEEVRRILSPDAGGVSTGKAA